MKFCTCNMKRSMSMVCVLVMLGCNQDSIKDEVANSAAGNMDSPWFIEVSSNLGVAFQYESGAS